MRCDLNPIEELKVEEWKIHLHVGIPTERLKLIIYISLLDMAIPY